MARLKTDATRSSRGADRSISNRTVTLEFKNHHENPISRNKGAPWKGFPPFETKLLPSFAGILTAAFKHRYCFSSNTNYASPCKDNRQQPII